MRKALAVAYVGADPTSSAFAIARLGGVELVKHRIYRILYRPMSDHIRTVPGDVDLHRYRNMPTFFARSLAGIWAIQRNNHRRLMR